MTCYSWRPQRLPQAFQSLILIVSACLCPAVLKSGDRSDTEGDELLPVVSLAQCGWTRHQVYALHRELRAARWRDIDQLMLVHEGRVAWRWGRHYAGIGPTRCDLGDIVLSMLVGIAIERGDLAGTDERLDQYLTADELRHVQGAVTVEDVLTLDYPRLSGRAQAMELLPLLRYLQMSPIASASPEAALRASRSSPSPPSSAASRDPFVSDLSLRCIEIVLERATDESVGQYARQHLFRPLDIARRWMPESHNWGPRRRPLNLITRDLAKLGLLYQNGGRWNGRQVVPESWVAESLRPHVKFADGALGYRWCLKTLWAGDRNWQTFAAIGRFGHSVIVVPEAELVVVVIDTRMTRPPDAFQLIAHHILPNFARADKAFAGSVRE